MLVKQDQIVSALSHVRNYYIKIEKMVGLERKCKWEAIDKLIDLLEREDKVEEALSLARDFSHKM